MKAINPKFFILFIGLSLFFPFVFAETREESYTTIVSVHIDTGSNQVAILLEGSNTTYSIVNSTNSYTVNFKRNVTCQNSSNLTQVYYYNYYNTNTDNSSVLVSSVDRLTNHCSKIADAYGDAAAYYKPLLECTTTKAQCEKDRDIYKVNSDKVASLEANYKACDDTKKNTESQYSSCNAENTRLKAESTQKESELAQSKSNSKLYGWILTLAAIGIAGYFYTKKKKEKNPPLEGTIPQ